MDVTTAGKGDSKQTPDKAHACPGFELIVAKLCLENIICTQEVGIMITHNAIEQRFIRFC
jgi:hypothetical protein